jgi:lipid II:glycine glycyltransferase (peptidoglycan interpeptide bridge formation enzyme)
MSVYTSNPLQDNRWDEFVQRHPHASVFHTREWLEALTQTYGYEPILLTTTPKHHALNNGLVFCKVSSWVTGTRLVSLPFADHCEPLVDNDSDRQQFLDWLQQSRSRSGWKYVELRPLSALQSRTSLQPDARYRYHELDITPRIEQIFQRFHKDSIQRRIQRAERARLSCETGRSTELLDDFYRLVLMTRRRHRLLPQPRTWFKNLVERMGKACEIRVARNDGVAIAALLTLRHRSVVTYKYGCSNARFHHLGGMPFLFWRLIEDSKAQGADRIDFGRSDLDQRTLSAFKDKLGTTSRFLTYYRCPRNDDKQSNGLLKFEALRRFCAALPDSISSTAGSLLYRHMG